MAEVYWRLQSADEDPEKLLDPEEQGSEPWGGTVYGRCGKCGGEGEVEHECESCKEGGPDASCPSCGGELRYLGDCPACEGSGEIDERSRDGVSVFPDEDGLYRYMVKRDANIESSVLVKLEGKPSDDRDFDADEGAVLVHPTRIVSTGEPEWERVEELKRQSG